MDGDSAAKFLLGLCAMLAFLIGSAAATLWEAAGSFYKRRRERRAKSQSETS